MADQLPPMSEGQVPQQVALQRALTKIGWYVLQCEFLNEKIVELTRDKKVAETKIKAMEAEIVSLQVRCAEADPDIEVKELN